MCACAKDIRVFISSLEVVNGKQNKHSPRMIRFRRIREMKTYFRLTTHNNNAPHAFAFYVYLFKFVIAMGHAAPAFYDALFYLANVSQHLFCGGRENCHELNYDSDNILPEYFALDNTSVSVFCQ